MVLPLGSDLAWVRLDQTPTVGEGTAGLLHRNACRRGHVHKRLLIRRLGRSCCRGHVCKVEEDGWKLDSGVTERTATMQNITTRLSASLIYLQAMVCHTMPKITLTHSLDPPLQARSRWLRAALYYLPGIRKPQMPPTSDNSSWASKSG